MYIQTPNDTNRDPNYDRQGSPRHSPRNNSRQSSPRNYNFDYISNPGPTPDPIDENGYPLDTAMTLNKPYQSLREKKEETEKGAKEKKQHGYYSLGGSGGGDDISRVTLNQRYLAPAKTRPAFSLKHTWTGQQSTFEEFSRKVAGWLMQVGAGYLLDPHFIEKYRESTDEYLYGDDCWE